MTISMEDAWQRIGELQKMMNVAPVGGNQHHDRVLRRFLKERPRLNQSGPALNTLDRTKCPDAMPGSMSRWLTIEYPRAAAERIGAYGITLRVSDILRFVAESGHEKAEYLRQLARALDAEAEDRPAVASPNERHKEALRGYLDLINVIENSAIEWPREALEDAYLGARDAYFAVERGHAPKVTIVDYPADFSPPSENHSERAKGLAIPTGQILREMSETATYLSDVERHHMQLAVLYFPDDELQVEGSAGGDSLWVTDLRVVHGTDLEPAFGHTIGSMLIDHYGDGSAFSSDALEFDFQVVMPAADSFTDEFEDCCFLVSHTVTYVAAISRD